MAQTVCGNTIPVVPEDLAWRKKKAALKETALGMSEIDLRLALLMIIEGADIDYAIDTAWRKWR